MAPDLSYTSVGNALSKLGNFRVKQAQFVAAEGPPDLISGALLLSLGLRESHLQNIENPAQTDKGAFQITTLYHEGWLEDEPGCPVGTWRAIPDANAAMKGFVPRYTPALVYALNMLNEAIELGSKRYKLEDENLLRFGIAAYNAGVGGAIAGLQAGDIDLKTTGGDYSAWVIKHRSLVQRWLREHPNWKP